MMMTTKTKTTTLKHWDLYTSAFAPTPPKITFIKQICVYANVCADVCMKHLNLLMHLHGKCIHLNTYATKMLRVYCVYIYSLRTDIFSMGKSRIEKDMSIKYNSLCLPFIWHIWHQMENFAIDLTSTSHLHSPSLSFVPNRYPCSI